MQTPIEITGGLLMALALLHAVFPRYFRWKEETAGLSLLTRQILHVHTFFIALTVFLMGLLCLTSAVELTGTPLGRKIALGLAVFWGIRLVIQFFGYSSSSGAESPSKPPPMSPSPCSGHGSRRFSCSCP